MFPDIKIVRIIGDFFGLECWFDRGLWSLNQRGIFEGADCDICVAVSVRSWMDVARGLEGRQLKWMRRKTGLRFFEHPPKLAPGLPRCPAASMISPCWHQGVLATHLARRSSHLLTRHQVDQSILTQGKVRLKKHGTFCWQSIKPEMFQSGPRIACIGLC